jgi:hypothetical protein
VSHCRNLFYFAFVDCQPTLGGCYATALLSDQPPAILYVLLIMLRWVVNGDLLGPIITPRNLGALPRVAPDLKTWLAWCMRSPAWPRAGGNGLT